MEYWDEKDIAEAKANGIGYVNFYARVYHYGWTVEEAKTKPVNSRSDTKRKYPKEIMELAEKNGISRNLFYKRINRYKWDERTAATTPVPEKRKYPEEYYKKAVANGVSRRTFRWRIRQGWALEDAIQPPWSKSEAGKMAVQKRRERVI
ncbi:hypothetical protein [Halobacillus karajensis]|uniref:Uncharacterized protein n=1 Tax=Halobacillus karajensis TaxID=195088 RepID=A0A059NUY3_9BACI|nr:hypothetical protein [Halobacillus karajensis]CDQ22599.1 hypothetical protein BN983_00812 [Halobacillus karajensis]CDQ26081.1 hypothetical protein BN981_00292 [Halobacillus karajensis]